jgi:hypothetical protein
VRIVSSGAAVNQSAWYTVTSINSADAHSRAHACGNRLATMEGALKTDQPTDQQRCRDRAITTEAEL